MNEEILQELRRKTPKGLIETEPTGGCWGGSGIANLHEAALQFNSSDGKAHMDSKDPLSINASPPLRTVH